MKRRLARWRLRRQLRRLTRQIDPQLFDAALSAQIDRVVAELDTLTERAA